MFPLINSLLQAGRICHTVKPGDGEAVTFTLRDETACSGEATDFSEFKDGSLAGVAPVFFVCLLVIDLGVCFDKVLLCLYVFLDLLNPV